MHELFLSFTLSMPSFNRSLPIFHEMKEKCDKERSNKKNKNEKSNESLANKEAIQKVKKVRQVVTI